VFVGPQLEIVELTPTLDWKIRGTPISSRMPWFRKPRPTRFPPRSEFVGIPEAGRRWQTNTELMPQPTPPNWARIFVRPTSVA